MGTPMFTKGPWSVEVMGVRDLDGREICEIVSPHQDGGNVAEYVWREDANLIVATHDLLAVAQMVLDTATDTTPPELMAAALAALKNALGEQGEQG